LALSILVTVLIVLLIGLFSLAAINSAFRRLQRKDLKKQFQAIGNLFFYRSWHLFFFPEHELEAIFFVNTFAQNTIRFFYALLSFLIILQANIVIPTPNAEGTGLFFTHLPLGISYLIGFFLLFFIIGDYLPRIFGIRYPSLALKLFVIPASFFMLILFPFTFFFLKISRLFWHTLYFVHLNEPHTEAKQEIIDMIEESNVSHRLDMHDKKLLESVMGFRDRIAREVMVPRVDVFSLPHDATIEEAANQIINEGYSRIPVYKNTLDNIIGVLMYKDVLNKYMEYANKNHSEEILKAPIAILVKNVLYTPETKKISQLLQEFRKKQVHLAIVVDEYGGTEGIVSIEDILEEIVGDIADEYDEEEALFIPLPNGGWLIDARMNISDVEEQLGIEIPQEGDYDTIGGYIFNETGTIPAKGFVIRKHNFELEVLRSDDRRVEKIRIQPLLSNEDEERN
jgi:CBS domain containing-hemolysin-like protein